MRSKMFKVMIIGGMLLLSACAKQREKEQLIQYLANPEQAQQAARLCLAKLEVGESIKNDIDCQAVIQYGRDHCEIMQQQGGMGEAFFFDHLDCRNPEQMLVFAAKGM